MSQIVLGTSQPVQQPDRIEFTSARGKVTIRPFEAAGEAGKANLRAMLEQLEANQLDASILESAGKSRIEITYGYDPDSDPSIEAPVTRWESRTNRVTKEVYQSPNVFKYQSTVNFPITTANTTALSVLRACVNAQNLTAAVSAGITSDPKWNDWYEAFRLLMSGTTGYEIFQPVLTKIETVSSLYIEDLVADTDNLGTIFSARQMVAAEEAPQAIVPSIDDTSLPAGLTPWDNSSTTAPGYTQGFHYGYLKNNPDMVQQAQNKWSLTTHYEFGIWPMFLYRPALTDA